VGCKGSRYKSTLRNECAPCISFHPYPNISPLFFSQSFQDISHVTFFHLSYHPEFYFINLFYFIFDYLIPLPVKFHDILDYFISKYMNKRYYSILWVTSRNLEDWSGMTPCQHSGSESCVFLQHMAWLLLDLHLLPLSNCSVHALLLHTSGYS